MYFPDSVAARRMSAPMLAADVVGNTDCPR
jgi:hypothetical protein